MAQQTPKQVPGFCKYWSWNSVDLDVGSEVSKNYFVEKCDKFLT